MKTEIRFLSHLKLESPILIEGFLDLGLSQLATQMLIEKLKPKKIAELYSPYFPSYAIAELTGLCHLPTYELYASKDIKPNTIILVGESKPVSDKTNAWYEVFNEIILMAKEMHCKMIISIGSFISENNTNEIFLASNSKKLLNFINSKLGGKIFKYGMIDGAIGLILGIAKIKGIKGICVLAPYTSMTDRKVAIKVYKYIIKILELERDL